MLISILLGIGLGLLAIRILPEEVIDLLRFVDDEEE